MKAIRSQYGLENCNDSDAEYFYKDLINTVVLSDNSVNERIVRCWFTKFHSRDKSLENEKPGRPFSVVNNNTWDADLCKVLKNLPENLVLVQ